MTYERSTAVAGIAFVVLVLGAFLVIGSGIPGGGTTNADAAQWLKDSRSHQQLMAAGAYATAFGALAFLWFAVGLIRRMDQANCDRSAVEIVRGTAFLATALFLVYAASLGAPAFQLMILDDAPAVEITFFGVIALFMPTFLCCSAMVFAVSVEVFRHGFLPRWLGVVGCLCGLLLLFAMAFVPAITIFAWALCVSMVLLVRPQAAPATPAVAAGAYP